MSTRCYGRSPSSRSFREKKGNAHPRQNTSGGWEYIRPSLPARPATPFERRGVKRSKTVEENSLAVLKINIDYRSPPGREGNPVILSHDVKGWAEK
jgi:hypothetical protein